MHPDNQQLCRFSANRLSLAGLTILVLTLLLTACSGLAGEPRIVATAPPRPTSAQPVVQDIGYPVTTPSLALGASIYVERCARCHGVTGDGDSEFVRTGQLPERPPDFTNPETARGQTPAEWFSTITNGRIDKLMPPWTSLNENDRWAVAMYTYTLAYPADQLALGEEVWLANCAECHGETGRGDGPRAAEINRPVGDLTVQSEMVALSDDAIYNIVTEGTSASMPAFGDDLDETQRRAVVTYARTLGLNRAAVQVAQNPVATEDAQPAATAEPAAVVLGTITGSVQNATSGGTVPGGMTVVLHILDSDFNDQPVEGTTDDQGRFTFENVEIQNDRGYAVTVDYKDHTFGSNLIPGDTTQPSFDLPVNVYEVTDDPSVIKIVGIVMQITPTAAGIQVAEVFSLTNTSDRLFTTSETLDGTRSPSVRVALPPGAQVMSFDNPNRYALSEDGSAVIDTRPVIPNNDHIVHMIYTLPYSGSATIEYPVNYALQGPVRLLLSSPSMTVVGDMFASMGPQTVGSNVYQGYGNTLDLQAGDVIRFELTGSAAAPATTTSTTQAPVVTSDNLLSIVLIALGAVVVLVAGFLYMRGRSAPAPAASARVTGAESEHQLIDGLVRQIAELDDTYQSGEIDEATYNKRRSRLKKRLAELMDE